jgi:putative Mg2+ transporter-C (MgtC) family protein
MLHGDDQRMDIVLDEIVRSLPDAREAIRVALRLAVALLAGTVIGLQRERSGKAAGLRTHILVCLGTTMFVIAGAESGMQQDAMSRVIQGLATGIGFLGAGAIIKQESTREIRGLTTAAGIWITSPIGVAIGLGHLGTAVIGVLVAWAVLALFVKLEKRPEGSANRA